MTAFAAILAKEPTDTGVDGVADELSSVCGRPATTLTLGRCTLVTAPLHATDAAAPVLTTSGTVLIGSVQAGRTPFAGSAGDASRLGEYAVAQWDARQQLLLCARDGFGLRLLYVAQGEGTIVVTNVLAVALRHPRIAGTLDDTALVAFLAHGGPPDAVRTCYRDVSVLPPGHTLSIAAPSFSAKMWRHWHFPLPDGIRRNDATILEEYRSHLADAVRDRLDSGGTSIFLSGGIDSTTMAAAATEVAPPRTLSAITTRYPRYVDDIEVPFARAAAERLALPLAVVDADRHEPWYADPQEPPPAFPLDEPMLADWRDALACAARHGTVALYGEDGDALLRPPSWHALRQSQSLPAIGIAAARYALTERRRPYVGLRWRERLGIVPPPAHGGAPAWLSAAGRAMLGRCEPGTVLGCVPEPLPPHPTRPEAQAVLTSTTISRHFAATIAPETTRRGVELRFPILDARLLRLVVSIPSIPWCQHKTLPRRAYRGRLPDHVLDRPKTPLIGFNEGMVAAWRSHAAIAARPADPVAEWVDVETWTRALQHGAPEAVIAAWRVSALDAWLARRSNRPHSPACTR